ncbi:lipocalin family protein [Chitinophaga filiformis]|uniref:Lipocalin-like domain-containing protein n=1 Tax=Chitinophaga filiformis TaxID=104663 RepID=A0A1G7XTC6_CHIFI|nr:lipocalin family protein [Chitinophaga filiformis]SDG87465.1 hypothetical protein SAMN04488121_10772 [Chitinophaga filiformis]
MKKYFALLLVSLSGIMTQSYAQYDDPATFADMISKEWKLQFYGESGKKQAPSSKQQEDRMIFYKDNRVLSIENGKKETGNWQYDPSKKLLTITDNQTREQTQFQVIKLNEAQFVVGYKDPEGVLLEIHMLPVKK